VTCGAYTALGTQGRPFVHDVPHCSLSDAEPSHRQHDWRSAPTRRSIVIVDQNGRLFLIKGGRGSNRATSGRIDAATDARRLDGKRLPGIVFGTKAVTSDVCNSR